MLWRSLDRLRTPNCRRPARQPPAYSTRPTPDRSNSLPRTVSRLDNRGKFPADIFMNSPQEPRPRPTRRGSVPIADISLPARPRRPRGATDLTKILSGFSWPASGSSAHKSKHEQHQKNHKEDIEE